MSTITKEALQREMSDLLTVEEVAKLLRYNPQHVRLLARTGNLPGRKRRHQWLFKASDIQAFVTDTDINAGDLANEPSRFDEF